MPKSVKGDLKGCPKVGGAEEPQVGGNPDITGDCRVNHNLVCGGATRNPATRECSAGVWREWNENAHILVLGNNGRPAGKVTDVRK